MSGFLTLFMERKGELLGLLIEHMDMTAVAVLVSLAIGVPIGILITKNERVSAVIIGIANLMQSIPSIGLLAFMVPFVGIGQKPAVIMVVIYALLPIIKNTYTGITSIDPRLMEASRGIGLSKLQQLFRVQLPIAMPFIMAGVRISAVTAVGTVTIAAFAGAGGLGWMINLGLNANDANLVLLGAIPACILALLVDFVLGKVESEITPEGLKPSDQIVYRPRKKRVMRRALAMAMCALMLVIPAAHAAFGGGTDDDVIVVGAENFTESLILGYLYSNLIKYNTDIPVEETFNLNGTMITMAALESGDIDMFTDYTGVIAPNILKLPMSTNTQEVYDDVKTGMMEEYGMEVSPSIGFSNTYIFAVSHEVSEKFGMTKLSDLLAQAGNLRLGCTTAFTQREDLLPKLKKDMNVEFGEVVGLEGNIRYQAIKHGEVDVTDAYETDAMVMKEDLVTLEDDIEFFPPYEAVNIVNPEIYEKYPELEPLLAKLNGAIDTREMMAMNYAVDIEGETPENAALSFLREKGLIK